HTADMDKGPLATDSASVRRSGTELRPGFSPHMLSPPSSVRTLATSGKEQAALGHEWAIPFPADSHRGPTLAEHKQTGPTCLASSPELDYQTCTTRRQIVVEA